MEATKLFVALDAFRDVDGMYRYHGGDGVVTRIRKHHGIVLLLDGESLVDCSSMPVVPEHGVRLIVEDQARPFVGGFGLPRASAYQGLVQ